MNRKPKAGAKGRTATVTISRKADSLNSVERISAVGHETAFREVLALIERARERAFQAVNTELIDLYWRVGEYIAGKLESAAWGDGVVDELASFIQRAHPGLRGFTRRNLFRMRQFFVAYRREKKVSALLTQLPWTHNLLILSRATYERKPRSLHP